MIKNTKQFLLICLILGTILPQIRANQACDPSVIGCATDCSNTDNTFCCDAVLVSANCQTTTNDINTGCDTCDICDPGFYLNGNSCESCSSLDPNCDVCQGGVCLSCTNSKLLQAGVCVDSCSVNLFYDNGANQCISCSTLDPNSSGSSCVTCTDSSTCTSYCDDLFVTPGETCLTCDAFSCLTSVCSDPNASLNLINICVCNERYIDDGSGVCICDTLNGFYTDPSDQSCKTCDELHSHKNQIDLCYTCNSNECLTGDCEINPPTSGFISNGQCTPCSDFNNLGLQTCTQCSEKICLSATCADSTYAFNSVTGQCESCDVQKDVTVQSCTSCAEIQGQPGSIKCNDGTCVSDSTVFDSTTGTCIDCDILFGSQNINNPAGVTQCTSCTLTKCTGAGACVTIGEFFDPVLGYCRIPCNQDQYFDGAICQDCTTINSRCTTCDATPSCLTVECLSSQYETTGSSGKECVNCNTINSNCNTCHEDPVHGPVCDAVDCLTGKYSKTDPVTGSKSCGSCSDFNDVSKPLETCTACNEVESCTDRNCPTPGTFKDGGNCNLCNDVAFFGANCLTCDINTCLTNDCPSNSYYDQTLKTCVSCSIDWSNNCLTCNQNACLTNDCAVGTFYSQDLKSCVSCSDVPNGGVDQCTECDDAQTTTTCTNCGIGYVIDSTGIPFCDSCSNKYTGLDGTCLTCDANNCLSIQCSDGYYDNNLTCELCTNTYSDDCITCDSSTCLTFCPAGQVNALPCQPCWQFHNDNKALTCDLNEPESSCLPGFVPLNGVCVQCSAAVSDDTCAECHPVDYSTASCDLNCNANEYAFLGQCHACTDKFGSSCATCSFNQCTLTCQSYETPVNGICVQKTCQEVYGIRCLICDFGLDLCTTTCSSGFYVDDSVFPNVCSDCQAVLGASCASCDDGTTCLLDCSTQPGTHPTGGLCCEANQTEQDGQCTLCSDIYGPDCLTCDNNECLSCQLDSFSIFGACIPCQVYDFVLQPLQKCANCDENQCNEVCEGGQYAKDGSCHSCSDFGNCAICNDAQCQLQCNIFEFPENGGCQSCSDVIPQCATCTGSDPAQCTLLCVAPEVPMTGICCQTNQYNDNGVCADCTAVHGPFCEACSGVSTCDICRFGKDINGLCIEQCELNQYGTYPDCTDCSTIDANCKTCTDANTCTLCQDDQGQQQYINGLTCVSSCPAGTFDAGSFICQACAAGCLDCVDGVSCNDCGTGNYFNAATPACEACPAGLGVDCVACSIDGTTCTDCGSNNYFNLQSGTCELCGVAIANCVSCTIDGTSCTDCGTGNYFNQALGTCDSCSSAIAECLECSIDGTTCSLCTDRHQWDGAQCAEIPCTVTDCSSCVADIDLCDACGNNKILDLESNTCVDNCGSGRYNNNGVCNDCIENCQACQDDVTCDDCGSLFLKTDKTCTDNCGERFFANAAATPKVCVPCADSHCLTCTSGSAGGCSTCEQGWFSDGNGGCTNVNPAPCSGQCQAWTNRIYKKGEKACHDNHCFTAIYETRLNFDEPDIYSWSAYWTVNYDITCATAAPFDKNKVYNTGQFVIYNGSCWKAKWQNTAQWWDGNLPGKGTSWTKQ